jgi:hypothetical protein
MKKKFTIDYAREVKYWGVYQVEDDRWICDCKDKEWALKICRLLNAYEKETDQSPS